MPFGHMYGQEATPINPAATSNWIKQRWVPWSPFAITENGASQETIRGIYKGARSAVSSGFPEDGVIPFFRAGRDNVGQANSNVQVSDGKFDWPLEVAGIALKVVFPRSIVDGCDLRDIDGNLLADPLAARKLASRYTRFFELFVNNSMLIFRIAEDEIARVPLEWVGSGPASHVEGLSISSGPAQTYSLDPIEDNAPKVSPSVAAFSARIGDQGKKDLWNLGEGALLVEQQSIELVTVTDANIVQIINNEILGKGFLYEDAKVGIRIKVGLYGDRTKQANYGAM